MRRRPAPDRTSSIDGPVLTKLLGAEHQHVLVQQLEVFDDGQRLECFTETDAISNNAAIVGQNLVNGPFDTILLKVEESIPNFGVIEVGSLVQQPAATLVD